MTNIYQSPDIRRQTLDEASVNISQKRVARMMMAMKAQVTIKERASKVLTKDLVSFEKRVSLVNNWLAKAAEAIDKAQLALDRLNEVNHGIVNAELVINATD